MSSVPEPVIYGIRPELEYSTQTHQGQSFLVVKDPVTDRYFRFPESQAAILELLRSPADLDTLADLASERLGTEVPHETLRKFLDSLDSKTLLDTPTAQAKLAQMAERKPK